MHPIRIFYCAKGKLALDYNCIRYLEDASIPQGGDSAESLNRRERAHILIAVLCGNLEIEGVATNPQQELHEVLDIRSVRHTIVRLRAILESQYAFGAVVGAPILFYVGSFAYAIANLHKDIGDKDTARSLAFGIWWMCIVHVSIISGCLLASNNPSAAAAIVGEDHENISLLKRLELARTRSSLEDVIEAYLGAVSGLSLVYHSRYEPVWMWARGKCKARWLRNTEARKKPWFREKVEINIWGWGGLVYVATFLVLLPSSIAFWIEFITPQRGVACRSLTILMYSAAQLIMIALTAWSNFKDSRETSFWAEHPWLNGLRSNRIGYITAFLLLLPAWLGALLATLAGTLMQLTGIFENCLCALSVRHWVHPENAIVTLSSDTEADRLASSPWVRAGAAALASLTVITYLGWWCQRYLRETFRNRVEKFANAPPRSRHAMAEILPSFDQDTDMSHRNTDSSRSMHRFGATPDSTAIDSIEISRPFPESHQHFKGGEYV